MMHIPDGFLDPYWAAATYAASALFYATAYKLKKESIDPQKLSLLTTLAAGIFVAQMLNWPLPGGTSLHLVGAALAAILLGPFYGAVAMGLVLLVQCLVFHDGGITTLGANVLNMAVVGVLVGYYLYKAVVRAMGANEKSVLLGAFLGGWMSVFVAGVLCGVEVGLSPQFPYAVSVSVPVMGLWHLALGVIEGIITGLVALYIYKRNPALLQV